MISCPNCNTEYEDFATFCNKCNLDLVDSEFNLNTAQTSSNSLQKAGVFLVSILMLLAGTYSYFFIYWPYQALFFIFIAYAASTYVVRDNRGFALSFVKWVSFLIFAYILGGKIVFMFMFPSS